MNYFIYIIIEIFVLLTAKKIVSWLAILQQKEYRLDRISLFLQSKEGKHELFSIIPKFSEFTRTGFKRPKQTMRIYALALFSTILYFSLLAFIWRQSNIELTLLTVILLYLVAPLLVIFPSLILSLPAAILTKILLILAGIKLRSSKTYVIGITGSYGKTSTKLLLNHILSSEKTVICTPKSFNTPFSISRSILRLLHKQDITILEYAAYNIGEIHMLTKYFPPTIAIITGFSPQHLGLFGSEEQIKKAKAELVVAVPKENAVFCNGDDQGAIEICSTADRTPTLFSSSSLKSVQLDEKGKLSFVWNRTTVHTQLIGTHYAITISAAIAVAQHLGIRPENIIKALESFVPPQTFVQIRKSSHGATVIDDGRTSNPKGFLAALSLLETLKKQRAILITNGIVDLGKSSSTIHGSLAKSAHNTADLVIYTGTEGKKEFLMEEIDKVIFKIKDLEAR